MKKLESDKILFSIIGYAAIIIVSLLCVIPFIFILSGSFSSEASLFKYGYTIIPKVFSLEAYKFVFASPQQIVKAYFVTIMVTVIGTIFGLLFTAMTGYVLNRKELRTRNFFSFFFYLTTLVNGGLVPWYMLIYKYMGLRNNYLALLLPLLFNVFYFIIMRTFMATIPDAITESARIDGAGDFYIFRKIILPLSRPALATIGLFIALRYWNDWYNAMLFIPKDSMIPLQFFLYKLLSSSDFANQAASNGTVVATTMPTETFKLAMTIVATGPIIFLFPLLQKYFIKGITIGAVKG